MTLTRGVFIFLLIVVIGLAVAPGVSGTGPLSAGELDQKSATDDHSIGAAIDAFVQYNAANTQQAVESELFVATYEAAPDDDTRGAVVDDRTDVLAEKLEEVTREYERLTEEEPDLSVPQQEVRMIQLTVHITALERAIEDAKERAHEVGADTERLEELRANTSELHGADGVAIVTGDESPRPAIGTTTPVPGLPNQSEETREMMTTVDVSEETDRSNAS